MIKCGICGEERRNLQSFSNHLRFYHKEITREQYYDLHVNPDEDKKCSICGQKRKFIGITVGYAKTCSDKKCIYKYIDNLKLNNIDNNGLNGHQQIGLLSSKTWKDKTIEELKLIKEKKEISTTIIGKDGLNSRQRGAIKYKETWKVKPEHEKKDKVKKMINTKETNIDENGLNGIQRGKITYKQTMSQIGEDGLTGYQRMGKNVSKALKSKSKEEWNDRDKKTKKKLKNNPEIEINRIKKIRETNSKKTPEDKNKKTIEYMNTCLVKYNGNNYAKSENFKILFKDKNFVNNMNMKKNITKKKNGTFRSSKPEKEMLQELINIYGEDDIVYNEIHDLYPFQCDFYIKSKDLYIELNLHPTHGKEPFDIYNKDHIELVQKFINKDTKYYWNNIEVWTERDVKKREVAKQNNLNYLMFYKYDKDKILERIRNF